MIKIDKKYHYRGEEIVYGDYVSGKGGITHMLRDYPHGKRTYPMTDETDYQIKKLIWGLYKEIIDGKLQVKYAGKEY